MEYHELLLRFVGRMVCVSTFGHVKLWGKLAAITEDCLRLVNTSQSSEADEPWLMQQDDEDGDTRFSNRLAETLVHFHHVVAISCLDDDLPAVNLAGNNRSSQANGAANKVTSSPATFEDQEVRGEEELHHFLRTERLEVRIGFGLIGLADAKQGGDLSDRMNHLRNLIGSQLGFVLPPVRIRDDSRFDAEEYRIYMHGTEVARGKLQPGKLLAIAGPKAVITLNGDRTFEPAYGQPAVWIEPEQRAHAEKNGYFAVEPSTVFVTHLQKEVRRHAAGLFSLDTLRQMLEHTRRYAPAAVEEVVPTRVSMPRLHDLLSRLLEEEVPLCPFDFILEEIAQLDAQNASLEELLIDLRTSLGRIVCERHRNAAGQISVFTLDRVLHDQLAHVLLDDPEPGFGEWMARFIDELRAWYTEHRELETRDMPLVVDTVVRRKLWTIISQAIPGLMVISFSEIAHDLPVNLVATLNKKMLGLQDRPAKKITRSRKAAVASPSKKEMSSSDSHIKPPQPR